MSDEKRVLGGIVDDALAGLDLDSDQKPVNKVSSFGDRFDEIVNNTDKSGGVENFGKDVRSAEKDAKIEEEPVRWFSELDNEDVLIAGGKGASLGEMFQNKFPVPPGFVVTAGSFDYFLSKSGIKEKVYDMLEKNS